MNRRNFLKLFSIATVAPASLALRAETKPQDGFVAVDDVDISRFDGTVGSTHEIEELKQATRHRTDWEIYGGRLSAFAEEKGLKPATVNGRQCYVMFVHSNDLA